MQAAEGVRGDTRRRNSKRLVLCSARDAGKACCTPDVLHAHQEPACARSRVLLLPLHSRRAGQSSTRHSNMRCFCILKPPDVTHLCQVQVLLPILVTAAASSLGVAAAAAAAAAHAAGAAAVAAAGGRAHPAGLLCMPPAAAQVTWAAAAQGAAAAAAAAAAGKRNAEGKPAGGAAATAAALTGGAGQGADRGAGHLRGCTAACGDGGRWMQHTGAARVLLALALGPPCGCMAAAAGLLDAPVAQAPGHRKPA